MVSAAGVPCVVPVSCYADALHALSVHHPALVVVAMAALEGDAQRFLEHLASQCPGLPCLVLAENVQQQERARGLFPGTVLLQGVPADRLTQAVKGLVRPLASPPQ